jgi:polyisoprenoid-binding protein YceI
MTSPRRRYVLLGTAVVAAAIVAGVVVWLVSGDAPDEVDLGTAASGLRERTTTTAGSTPGEAASAAVTGTWVVDADTGGFDYESATGSFVGFRVSEQLVGIGAATAVGRTGGVSGSMTIEGTTVTDATFEVDMASITTNESRRDRRVQDALNTDDHPSSTFRLGEPIDLGAEPNGPVSVEAVGELTVNGVTRPLAIPLEAELVGDTIVVVGSTEIVFSDFDVEVPSAPVVVSADDRGVLELQLLFVRS